VTAAIIILVSFVAGGEPSRVQPPGRATPVLDVHRLMTAFWMKEASGSRNPPRGKLGEWGIFQFLPPRWKEGCGWAGVKYDYGKATIEQQIEVMEACIKHYVSNCMAATIQGQVAHAARDHNGWGPASVRYSRGLLRLYERSANRTSTRSCGMGVARRGGRDVSPPGARSSRSSSHNKKTARRASTRRAH
jgi:hypothetical protein